MPLPSPKELQKLANACRKAGVLHFKCGEVEFTLDPSRQPIVVNKASKQTTPDNTPFQDRPELTEEELLLWSSGGLAETAS